MNLLSRLPLRCHPQPSPPQLWPLHPSLSKAAPRSRTVRFPHPSAQSGWPGSGRRVLSTHLSSLPATRHLLDREAFGHSGSGVLRVRAHFIFLFVFFFFFFSLKQISVADHHHCKLLIPPVCLGTEAMSGWSQPLMSSHMMHPQLQAEQSAFSQHQPMEQDDTGIANPANNYHQPQHLPNSYMDFPKVTQSQSSVDNLTHLPLMYMFKQSSVILCSGDAYVNVWRHHAAPSSSHGRGARGTDVQWIARW